MLHDSHDTPSIWYGMTLPRTKNTITSININNKDICAGDTVTISASIDGYEGCDWGYLICEHADGSACPEEPLCDTGDAIMSLIFFFFIFQPS